MPLPLETTALAIPPRQAIDILGALGVRGDGRIELRKVQEHAKVLDKFQWTDIKLDRLFKQVRVDKDGTVPVQLFDEWLTPDCEDQQSAFMKTFTDKELSGADIGVRVDLLVEFPSSAGAMPAWSPLKPSAAKSGEIVGPGRGGGTLIKMDEPDGRLLTVKQGQIRRTQFHLEPNSPKSPTSPGGRKSRKDKRWEGDTSKELDKRTTGRSQNAADQSRAQAKKKNTDCFEGEDA